MNPVRSSRGAEVRQEVMSAPSGSVSTLVKNFVTRLQTASSWKPTFIKKIGKWMNIYSDTTTNSSLTHTQPDLKTLSWSLFVFVSLPGWSPECEQEDNRRGSRRNMWPESWALTQKHRRASSARAGSAWAKWKRTSRKMSAKLLTCRIKMTWRIWISSWKNWGGNLFLLQHNIFSHSSVWSL